MSEKDKDAGTFLIVIMIVVVAIAIVGIGARILNVLAADVKCQLCGYVDSRDIRGTVFCYGVTDEKAELVPLDQVIEECTCKDLKGDQYE